VDVVIAAVSAETVIAALAAAGLGGVVSAAFGIRARRYEQMRERMLVAADEFSTAASEALVTLREVKPPWKPEHRNTKLVADPATVARSRTQLEERLFQARRLSGRVRLLFGPNSKAASHAQEFLHQIRFAAEKSYAYWVTVPQDTRKALLAGLDVRTAIEERRESAWQEMESFYEEARAATKHPDRPQQTSGDRRRRHPAAY
jgi:hypothetical protein